MFGPKPFIVLSLIPFSLFSGQTFAGQLSTSSGVQVNVTILAETKSCPQCDLSGANLNRLDLSGANLEGANLSRAKMSLTNLSGANLHNADLREAIFNGADLSNIDLRGANLTGASLVGAYMKGALLDGEMLIVTPYAHEEIRDIEETVYVEDTVNPKEPQETEEMIIGSRRDFEETPPVVPKETTQTEPVNSPSPSPSVKPLTVTPGEGSLPMQSAASPAAKVAPAIQEVRIKDNGVTSIGSLAEEPQPQKIVEESPASVVQGNGLNTSAKDVAVDSAENGQTQDIDIDKQKPLPATSVDEMPVVAEEGDNDSGVVDQAVGMVQELIGVFSTEEPSTDVLKNAAVLLDVNQCYGCNLTGVNLSGENLEGADLEGADLSYANLTGTDLQGANLKGANLTGANLTDADLSEADMYKTIMTDADVTGANLEETMLDDVELSGVKGYKKQEIMLMEKH